MKTYLCQTCGYINQCAVSPTYCVYCHCPGENLSIYKSETDVESFVRKSVAHYTKRPDPIVKSHEEGDSAFRSSLRRVISEVQGKELSEKDSIKESSSDIEKYVDEAVKGYAVDPCPAGTAYEELNSSIARHYRLAIVHSKGRTN